MNIVKAVRNISSKLLLLHIFNYFIFDIFSVEYICSVCWAQDDKYWANIGTFSGSASLYLPTCFGPLIGTLLVRSKERKFNLFHSSDVTWWNCFWYVQTELQWCKTTLVIWVSLKMCVFVISVSVRGVCAVLRSLTREACAPIVLILP